MKPINERLMLARLQISQWYPRKYDPIASQEVADNHGAGNANEVGRYNKILVRKESIKDLSAAVTKLQRTHDAMAAPWDDRGYRVLPADFYFDYCDEMRKAELEFEKAADDFAFNRYPAEVEAARVRLNGLFREEDFPEPHDVRARFRTKVKFKPLPNAADARVWGIGDKAAAEIEQQVRRDLAETSSQAQRHVIEQVTGRAREFIEKVNAYDKGDSKRLYATAVDNLREVTDLVIRGLNITGDQSLEKLAVDLSEAIAGLNVERLKNSADVRAERTQAVEDVLGKFEGVFG